MPQVVCDSVSCDTGPRSRRMIVEEEQARLGMTAPDRVERADA